MSEEKEAIKIVEDIAFIRGIRQDVDGELEDLKAIEDVLRLIDKLQKENETLKNKLKEIEAIVDTTPYVAYTDYHDILYESDEILEIIRGEIKHGNNN